jgi:hypothetical protein
MNQDQPYPTGRDPGAERMAARLASVVLVEVPESPTGLHQPPQHGEHNDEHAVCDDEESEL